MKTRNFSISDLVPKKTREGKMTDLQSVDKILRLLRFFSKMCIESREAFLSSNFEAFDALVGENACQIRAAKLMDLANPELSPSFLHDLEQAFQSAQDLLERLSSAPLEYVKKEATQDYIDRNGLDFLVSQDVAFLVMCYILEKTKVKLPTKTINQLERTETRNLLHYDIFNNQANNVVAWTQSLLSFLSKEYMVQEAASLGCATSMLFQESFLFEDKKARFSLPAFFVTEVILQRAKQKGAGLILLGEVRLEGEMVYMVPLTFEVLEGEFVYAGRNPGPGQRPYYVVHGVANFEAMDQVPSIKYYERKLRIEGPEKVILDGLATHPQYASCNKDRPIPFGDKSNSKTVSFTVNLPDWLDRGARRFFESQRRGKVSGLSLCNPTLFCTIHILCETPRFVEKYSSCVPDLVGSIETTPQRIG